MHYRRSLPLYCFVLAFFLAVPTLSQAVNLPDLGAPDLVNYDQQTEERFGRSFTASLHAEYALNYDPEVVHFVRKIGHKIASQTGQNRHFKFYVIDNDSINAFAGPNGVIGVHTGLIQAVQSEDELASVIAHEIAHVTQRHLSRRFEYQSNQGNAASIATILAAILIGIHDPNAGMATLMGGMGYNIEQQLKNSRQHESEADSEGIAFLHKANYNPYAMGQFFARLSKAGQNNSYSMPEILRTHPVTERRLAEAQNRAQTMPPLKPRKIDNSLNLIQLRLNQNNLHRESHDLFFTKQQQTNAESCYQLNLLTLNSVNNPTSLAQSRSCLWQLIEENPQQTLYSSLMMQSISQDKKPDVDLSRRILEHAEYQYALHPNDTAIVLRYADLLLSLGQKNQAKQLLESATKTQRYQYQLNQKLAEIYAGESQNAEAYYFQAVAQMDIGNTGRSEYLLEKSEELLEDTNSSLKQKIFTFQNKHAKLLKNKDKEDQ